jgi:site-specific DNA recombinase
MARVHSSAKDVWGYARISTPEQDEGFGLDVQKEEITLYCLRNGLNLLGIITDDCSGDLQFRPGLDKLISNLRQGVGGGVVVHRPDRLARKAWIAEWAMDEWHTMKLAIHFENLGLIENTPEARFQVGIMCQVGELDKAQMLRKMSRGRNKKVRDGIVLGNGVAPFGYRYEGKGKTSRLVIAEDEAAIVRSVFELYVLEDMGVQIIAERFTAERIPTAADRNKNGFRHNKTRGYGEWHAGVLYRILRNPTYYGKMPHFIWTKQYQEVNGVRKIVRHRSLSNPDMVYVGVPPIVSEELWQAAQARLAARTNRPRPNSFRQYLLARRADCMCGWKMAARTTRGGRSHYSETPYYYCNGTTTRNNRRCSMPHFNGRQVDALVWGWVEAFLSEKQALAAGLQAMQSHGEERREELLQRRASVERQLADTARQTQRLLSLYVEGSFDLAMIEQHQKQLEQRQAGLKDGLKEIEEELRCAGPSEEDIIQLQAFADKIRQRFPTVEFEQKRKIIELLGVRVKMFVEDGQRMIEVSCNIPRATLRTMVDDVNSLSLRKS